MARVTRSSIRWRVIAAWTVPLGATLMLYALLRSIDPWLKFIPREMGRRITEYFLRSLLIGYVAAAVVLPVVIVVSVAFLIRERGIGRRHPLIARCALLSASTVVMILASETLASAWLGWIHRMPWLPRSFSEQPASANELSLVVIGGSSAMGYPYESRLSVGQIVAWQLEEAVPGRHVRVENLAALGKNLEEMHQKLAGVKHKPDAVLIYSAQNEFLSRYEHTREAGFDELPENRFLYGAYKLSLHSPLCLLIYETIREHRLGGVPPPILAHPLLEPPAFTPSEHAFILTDFRRRLDAIVGYCERIGALPILLIPPDNESGFEPNRSVLDTRIHESEREAVRQQFLAALAQEESEPELSKAHYREILERYPDFAETHFRLARILEKGSDLDGALRHYIRAIDTDGFPVRCTSEIAQIHRDVAARHHCLLIDGRQVLRDASRRGIIDDELIHDAQHPTFLGHLTLAQAIIDRLRRRTVFGLENDPLKMVSRIDPTACATRFGFDPGVWTDACAKSGTYYSNLAYVRYNPSERLGKKRAFLDCGNAIRNGQDPDQLGVPGIGLHRAPETRPDWWQGNPETNHAGKQSEETISRILARTSRLAGASTRSDGIRMP